jgi:UDP-N-acetylmuramate--alanine ligase
MTAAYEPRPGTIPTLDVPDLSTVRRAHLVGIGGAGMSGIARLFLARGVEVTGSDLKASQGLEALGELGARIAIGHDAANLTDPEVVVISSAIPPANPELVEARRREIPVLMRAQALASLLGELRTIAVAGTHGKTTTTSMAAVVLERAGLDPTYVIGGELNESGSNARAGGGSVAVTEADESDGSFLLLRPAVGIVTNIEEDHLDFYSGREEIEAAFAAFAERCDVVVACGDDEGVRRVHAAFAEKTRTYGFGEDNQARLIEDEPQDGQARGRLRLDGTEVAIRLQVPGRHNLLNAAAVILAAREVGVDPAVAAEGLAEFAGVRRRFELRGHAAGADFVDDYAHHPSEITATLSAARAGNPTRLVAVFQPHRYSRTAAMWRELGESLAGADVVVITDVYGAGEHPVPGVTGKLLVEALLEICPGKRVAYLPRRSEVAGYVARTVRPGDLVLTLGAGDITMVADEILRRLEEAA